MKETTLMSADSRSSVEGCQHCLSHLISELVSLDSEG